jgi:hypothetical protein
MGRSRGAVLVEGGGHGVEGEHLAVRGEAGGRDVEVGDSDVVALVDLAGVAGLAAHVGVEGARAAGDGQRGVADRQVQLVLAVLRLVPGETHPAGVTGLHLIGVRVVAPCAEWNRNWLSRTVVAPSSRLQLPCAMGPVM